MGDGGMAPNWPAAFVVYVLLGTGIALFVIPRASTRPSAAAAFGALFGLVVYGVYDFTNYSTLRQWPFVADAGRRGVGDVCDGRVRRRRGPVVLDEQGHARLSASYPIRAVSKMTGIGIDTLRAWERRYARRHADP